MDKLDELEKRPDIDTTNLTPWDVVVEVLKVNGDVGIMTLKADMAIIKKIAEGFSAYGIGLALGVPTKNIIDLANTWGLTPMAATLDFSPLFLYRERMSAEELMAEINIILPMPIVLTTAEMIIKNIERYYELVEFIKKEDK